MISRPVRRRGDDHVERDCRRQGVDQSGAAAAFSRRVPSDNAHLDPSAVGCRMADFLRLLDMGVASQLSDDLGGTDQRGPAMLGRLGILGDAARLTSSA